MTCEHHLIEVRRITELPDRLGPLLGAANAEGFDSMAMLVHEWREGINRFNRPGEILIEATIEGEIAGIGGITQDFVDTGWLRMRRFYVRPSCRRRGIARKIALRALDHARPFGRPVVLYAAGPEAEAFWPSLGFVPVDREHTTHILQMEDLPVTTR